MATCCTRTCTHSTRTSHRASTSTHGRSIERCASEAGILAPSSLPSERKLVVDVLWGISELLSRHVAGEERVTARQDDVVEAEIPDGGERRTVADEGAHGADDGASHDVIVVVELVDGQSACDESCAEEGSEEEDNLPVCWTVVTVDLELSI